MLVPAKDFFAALQSRNANWLAVRVEKYLNQDEESRCLFGKIETDQSTDLILKSLYRLCRNVESAEDLVVLLNKILFGSPRLENITRLVPTSERGATSASSHLDLREEVSATRSANAPSPVQNEDGTWRYMNSDGSMAFPAAFQRALPFFDGQAVVQSNQKFGIIGRGGDWIVHPQFDELSGGRSSGRRAARVADTWGYIDDHGEWAIQPVFDDVFDFDGPWASFQLLGYFGFIDIAGKWISRPIFDACGSMNHQVASVCKEGKWGLLKSTGQWEVEPILHDEPDIAEPGPFLGSIIGDPTPISSMPTINAILVFEGDVYSQPDIKLGTPYFHFDQSDCIRSQPSRAGKALADLLGIDEIESTIWAEYA